MVYFLTNTIDIYFFFNNFTFVLLKECVILELICQLFYTNFLKLIINFYTCHVALTYSLRNIEYIYIYIFTQMSSELKNYECTYVLHSLNNNVKQDMSYALSFIQFNFRKGKCTMLNSGFMLFAFICFFLPMFFFRGQNLYFRKCVYTCTIGKHGRFDRFYKNFFLNFLRVIKFLIL